METIIQETMEFGNKIKLYHWKTKSYSRHKATCKFLDLYNNNLDRLIETLMGAKDKRFYDNLTLNLESLEDKEAVDIVKKFRIFLQKDFPRLVDKKDTDILNIRDEILADVNRLLYLFTLK